jgi:hypothetical protein
MTGACFARGAFFARNRLYSAVETTTATEKLPVANNLEELRGKEKQTSKFGRREVLKFGQTQFWKESRTSVECDLRE